LCRQVIRLIICLIISKCDFFEKMKFKNVPIKLPDINGKPQFQLPQHPHLVKQPFTQIACGVRGAGKTYSVLQQLAMMKEANMFEKYYIISPTMESDVKQKKFYDGIKADKKYKFQYYEEFNEDVFEEIKEDLNYDIKKFKEYEKIRKILEKLKKMGADKMTDDELFLLLPYLDGLEDISQIEELFEDIHKLGRPPCSIIVLDDCFGVKLLQKNVGNPFINWYVRHRHYWVSVITNCQSLSYLPRSIRMNTIYWVIFPIRDKKQLDVLYTETASCWKNVSQFEDTMSLVASQEHQFLYLDTSDALSPDMRIGFEKKVLLDIHRGYEEEKETK